MVVRVHSTSSMTDKEAQHLSCNLILEQEIKIKNLMMKAIMAT